MGKRTERSARQSAASSTHVALLRGINVGGKNKLPMAELVELFEKAGAGNVRTYIQSGNVVFTATAAAAKGVGAAVAGLIEKRYGFRVPVVVRTARELEAVLAGNPFLRQGADVAALHVAFLADRPDARRVAALDANRSPGDAFAVAGREIYLHLPHGVARSKLTNDYFDRALGTVSTVRNWRTVETLAGMAKPGQ